MKPSENSMMTFHAEPAESDLGSEPMAASSPCVKSGNCILIADHDEEFRKLVGSILTAEDYQVVEANTTDGATQLLLAAQPVAAIVDSKLAGGASGAAWIEQIRQDGCEIPIVFVSESWCDERVFSWLRDKLKVSVIIQKPIVPELFMHTVEGALPKRPGQKTTTPVATDKLHQEIEAEYSVLLQNEEPERVLQQIEEMTATLQMGLDTAARVQALKDAVESRILFNDAQQLYLAELPYIWQDLRMSLERTRITGSGAMLHEAKLKAHKFKGSSGTCGFPQIFALVDEVEAILCTLGGGARECVDQFTQRADGRASWSQISQLIEQGNKLIHDLVREHQRKQDGSEVPSSAPIQQDNGVRVLCVDDDHSLTGFLEFVLGKRGYTTRSVGEPIGILDVLDEFRPDLILLDAVMPGISGYEVCRMLKEHHEFKHIPIIFMTANSCSRRAAALRAGAEAFLSKPLLTDKLVALIEQLLPTASPNSIGISTG
jgi:CheY-like chemotaxis protein